MQQTNSLKMDGCFFERYILENAKINYKIKLLKHIWFKQGEFLSPMQKEKHIKKFINQEVENFYKNHFLNIPQIDFCITTNCTLKCKNCCALIPCFNERKNTTFLEFKKTLECFLSAINILRSITFIGGEPLINEELYKMIEYCAQNKKIDFISIASNATIMPDKKLIEVIKKYRDKIYFRLSDYGENEELKSLIKLDKIMDILKENKIKFQILKKENWYKEDGFSKFEHNSEETFKQFNNCWRRINPQIFNSRLDICSKAQFGKILGFINEDFEGVEITNNKNLKNDLIDFYNKNYFTACKKCIFNKKNVRPALQV